MRTREKAWSGPHEVKMGTMPLARYPSAGQVLLLGEGFLKPGTKGDGDYESMIS